MIISRYLLKEVCITLLVVTFVLLLVFLSQELVRYLNYIAAGKLAVNMLLRLLGFEIPYLLALLLPLGMYLGVLLAYGRLYANSEMIVLHACGFSQRRLLGLTTLFAIGVAMVVFILMVWVNPWIAAQREHMVNQDVAYEHLLQTLMPGRFQVSYDGHRVVYVEQLSTDHKRAQNIFLAEEKRQDTAKSGETPWVVVYANQGYAMKEQETGGRFFVASQGHRYEGVPGQNNYKIIQFNKYAVRLPMETRPPHQQEEAIPTMTLWRGYHQPNYAAELQWRLSLPLSVFLLVWLAVPLSCVKPRQGKYLLLLPAVLIYIIYANLLFVSRHWVEQKLLPITIGMWGTHGVLFLIMIVSMFLFSKRSIRTLLHLS
ncbi:MAG: LPS export ABC transporter permease LptF [Gammaproteobacteria bacterium RIFCSPHIGHO2_12_FULL_41_20]|nr:MAG: LPS export ABC transporter permease LptF [Gammaproteobacteria bacterium RIFCSPHIGHO2_12_FULL_41_20]